VILAKCGVPLQRAATTLRVPYTMPRFSAVVPTPDTTGRFAEMGLPAAATGTTSVTITGTSASLVHTTAITALSITIVIQRTTGLSVNGQYNTVGSQIAQSNSSTAATLAYQFSLVSGQTLSPGTNRLFAAQTSGTGAVHPMTGDTFTVTYTAGGVSFTQQGHF
jgi:hypothetical protein